MLFQTSTYAQNLTSSPYSRYGLGELNQSTFAPSLAMGGSFIAWHQDTLAPFFINSANPAGLAGLKLTTFELGGQAQFTEIRNQNTSLNKRNVNFSYGSVGFPLKRFGGAAFGIMPYSTVGYEITSTQNDVNIGDLTYVFQGNGGINKAFIASGVKPFHKQMKRFNVSDKRDTLMKYNRVKTYKRIKFFKQLASEFSIGASANYLFGSINQTTNVIYPNSAMYYNSRRERSIQVSDFIFNTGLQTHFMIDSVKNFKRSNPAKNRVLKDRMTIGVGFYAAIPSTINAKQSNIILNYALDGLGVARPKDTLLNSQNIKGNITLPFEMGFGLSIKKGEKLTLLFDAAKTNWSEFTYFGTKSLDFKNSLRLSTGLNFIPNKLAYGSSNYYKRMQYRLGFTYTDGYLDLKQTPVSNIAVTAGLGLPVGVGRFDDVSVINLSFQYGKMGSTTNNLLQENYYRIIVGFTFNKRWFIKYKYD